MHPDSDPIHFHPGEHDIRLLHDKWIYYVRAIKRGERFLGGGLTPEGGLVMALITLVFSRPLLTWHDRQPWKVGVVRLRGDHGGRIHLIHHERLPDGKPPQRRIAELVEDVRAGRFDE